MRRLFVRVCVSGAIAVCATLPPCSVRAYSQTLGEVTGHVTDPSGAAIPGVTITLTNVSTNGTRTTVTTDAGDYTFPSVPPGIYNVRAEHSGFKALKSNNIEVQVQQTVRLDLTLQVGQITESIDVSASATMLQAENAIGGHGDRERRRKGVAA